MSETYIIRRYDSIHKFVDAAVKNSDPRGGVSQDKSNRNGGENWTGATWDEAVKFAKYGGWEPDQAPMFRKLFDEMIPKLRKYTGIQQERFLDVSGDQVDVALFNQGEPAHMWNWVPMETEVTKRALCLVIGHSISAGVSSEALFIRGQAIIGLIRALQLFGFELEVWSEETVRPGWGDGGSDTKEDYYSVLTRLHAAGEIMDQSAVEFAVGNPAWLRRLLFAHEEGESASIRNKFGFKKGGGYGGPTHVHHGNLLNADLELDLGRAWFGEARRADERTAQDGVNWVVGQLKELGVLDDDAEIDWE